MLSAVPTVVISSAQQVDNAQSVNDLLDDVSNVLYQKHLGHQITLSEAQAHSLLGFMQRAYPSFSGNIKLNRGKGELDISVAVPQWFTVRFLNLRLVLNSNRYVDIESISLGKISLPGNSVW